MGSKADLAALDELIERCEKTMTRPFVKSEAPPQAQETSEVTETIDEKVSQDDQDLAAFYESLDSESE